MGMSQRQLQRMQRDANAQKGVLASATQDLRAKQAQLDKKLEFAKMTAKLQVDPGSSGLFQHFNAGPVAPAAGVSQHIPPNVSQILAGMTPEEIAKAYGITMAQSAVMGGSNEPNPVVLDRDWAQLFCFVPDGVYQAVLDSTQDLSYAMAGEGLRPDMEWLDVTDMTGTQRIPVHTFTISEDDLRRTGDAIGRLIDTQIHDRLVREANEIAKKYDPKNQALSLYAAVEEVLVATSQYPVIVLAEKLEPTPSGEHYTMAFAIQWVYEASMDEDDDEDYDPGVCPECGAHHEGCPPDCGGRR